MAENILRTNERDKSGFKIEEIRGDDLLSEMRWNKHSFTIVAKLL